MAVKMRTGRLTTKTTDPKTGARIADPDVYGKEVDGGTVSSWPEVRTMYQQGKLKKEFDSRRNVPTEVRSYLEGKTNTLSDKEFDEPILTKMQDTSGAYTGLAANLREGGSRYAAMEKSFKSAGVDVSKSPGKKINYDMAETPISGSNKMIGVGITTDLEYIRKKSQDDKKPTKDPDPVKIEKLPVKTAKTAIQSATVKGPKTLKSRDFEKPTPEKFVSPGVQKKGKASTGGTSVSMNPFAKGATSKGAAGRYVKQVVQSVGKTGGKSKDMMGYNRQEKQFKAYAGTSVLGESHIGKTAQDLNAYKKEYKSQRKEYRREGNAEGVAATGMEVKQARQAEKFVKGKQAHFNDENYRKTTGKTSRIAPDYRKSAENAANRNTMQAKLDAVSAKPTNKTSMY